MEQRSAAAGVDGWVGDKSRYNGFDPDQPGDRLTRDMLDGGWRSHGMRRLGERLDDATGDLS